MFRVWDTKYHLKPSLSIFKVKVTRSRKGQTENLGFGRRDICFWVSFSSRTRKMTLEYFWNGPNRANFESRENAEIAGNSVKMAFFDLQNSKTRVIFSRYLHEILYTYTPDRVLSHIFRIFENSRIFPNIFF